MLYAKEGCHPKGDSRSRQVDWSCCSAEFVRFSLVTSSTLERVTDFLVQLALVNALCISSWVLGNVSICMLYAS